MHSRYAQGFNSTSERLLARIRYPVIWHATAMQSMASHAKLHLIRCGPMYSGNLRRMSCSGLGQNRAIVNLLARNHCLQTLNLRQPATSCQVDQPDRLASLRSNSIAVQPPRILMQASLLSPGTVLQYMVSGDPSPSAWPDPVIYSVIF